MASTRDRAPDLRTRKAIQEILKQQGGQTAQSLSEELEVSAMAIRQHLYQLENEALVTYELEKRPIGRPAKLWKLTDAANRFFPDAHGELAVDLVGALKKTFGADGLSRIVAERAKAHVAAYRKRIRPDASLLQRLRDLAALRTEEGYMAEVLRESGGYTLVENHCPIYAAASACTGLCSAELDVFQAVLGKNVEIERTEHILDGARRCAYAVCLRETPPRRSKRRRSS
jgi:predicted ArsR family transcriptional regulator